MTKKPSPTISPERLEELRQMPYADYLHTPEWNRRRQVALKIAGGCVICNGTQSLQVHHRTYERRGCERQSDLTVLCARCHALFSRYGCLVRPEKQAGDTIQAAAV